jgi:hypothetical protein
MTNSQIFRISGLALFVGAVLFVVHLVARSAITAGADPVTLTLGSLWGPVTLLGVLGSALVLLGLPALYMRLAGTPGVGVLIGMVLVALAWVFFGCFLSLYSLLVMPWLASDAPSLLSAPLPAGITIAFIVALVIEFIGTILLAIPFLRGRLRPAWVGYLLLAAAFIKVFGTLLAPSGPASNLALNLLSNSGPMLFLLAVGYLGFRMQSEHAFDK